MTLAQHDYLAFDSAVGRHLLLVDGSRIFDLQPRGFEDEDLQAAVLSLLQALPARSRPFIDDRPLSPPPIRALSLNVAQSCNLACTYCYADEGKFGGAASRMGETVALDAVRLLLDQAGTGNDAVLGFMGGEPLLNRELLHALVPKALAEAATRGVHLRFSITTNATLLTERDADLFHEHGFTVSVSLDGDQALNDRQRSAVNGRGSYAKALAGLERLAVRRPRHLSVRATVTPGSTNLLATLEHLLGLGVDEVGFSPVVTAPSPELEFSTEDFDGFLNQMVACGERAKAAILGRRRYPFSNFETALHEIARGTHRPYPCGAGASYASVSAKGDLYACHRAIDDPDFAIGSLAKGPDSASRRRFLADRHLSRQEPCKTCWARQMCGGGCHQEVAKRGRVNCDYVRGWLTFCLAAYAEISELAPGYFADPSRFFSQPNFEARPHEH